MDYSKLINLIPSQTQNKRKNIHIVSKESTLIYPRFPGIVSWTGLGNSKYSGPWCGYPGTLQLEVTLGRWVSLVWAISLPRVHLQPAVLPGCSLLLSLHWGSCFYQPERWLKWTELMKHQSYEWKHTSRYYTVWGSSRLSGFPTWSQERTGIQQ